MNLETERLLLRPWTERDAEALYKYARDPLVGPAAGWPAHRSIEDSLSTIREVFSAPDTFAVVIKDNGPEPVGCIGLFRSDARADADEPEIGYWLGRPFWGRGYMPEALGRMLALAFRERGAERVWCSFYTGNEKSRRVIEKCGFRGEFFRECQVPLLGERRTARYCSMRRAEYINKYGESK